MSFVKSDKSLDLSLEIVTRGVWNLMKLVHSLIHIRVHIWGYHL